MGLRGPGAKPVHIEQKPKGKRLKAQPWDKPGLSRAERVIAFLETLPVTSGNLAGTKFRVRDFQRKKIIEPLYATDAQKLRFVREGFISLPRKNGKTGLIAGLCLCHLCGPEAVNRGQVASGAADREQAALIYTEMQAIIERVPWMNERVIVWDFKKQLKDAVTGTLYKALSSDSKTKHGLSLSFWIYDELAQAPDRKLYDVLSTSTAAWDEPLGIVISTQADDSNHIMSELYDDALQIQTGIIQDESKHVCIYSAPMEANPWDEKTWFDCNPALGDFRSLEEMRAFAKKAKRMPGLEATFRQLYLNQRVRMETRFIPKPTWDLCGEAPELFRMDQLKGRTCKGALDLSGSGKNDLTALVLDFQVDGQSKILPFFWAAADGLEAAEKKDRVPYRLWEKQKHLLTTPGTLLGYPFIAQKLAELTTTYRIEEIAVDPWNILRLEEACKEIGVNIVFKLHDQHYKGMDPAVTALENAVIGGTLRHNKNPILDWCVDNVMVTQDSTGNRKFDKRKSTGRIDGAVALAMAAHITAAGPGQKPTYHMHFV